jgi:predicted RNA-binding Zn-ribbon protein involved in translation (DUF1610 family)
MDDKTEIKLSLLENSHAFIREAVTYAVSAKNNARKWQFAVLNLVQALELSLKCLLFNIHPILIFDNVDNPKNTVSLTQALDRLRNSSIGNISFSESERQKIQRAIDLRNQMTHSEFVLKPEYATAKFFEVFAFIVYFQARHLHNEIETIISYDLLIEILAIEKSIKELAEKARQRILEENIDPEFISDCPNCGNDTFVIQDDINTCYACRQTEERFECKKCGKFFFKWEMEDFSNAIDTDYCEGQTIIHNNFGYDYYQACFECINRIREDIAQQRVEDEYHWEIERAYLEQKNVRNNS